LQSNPIAVLAGHLGDDFIALLAQQNRCRHSRHPPQPALIVGRIEGIDGGGQVAGNP
jgi:hypothetical protein